MKDNRNDSVRSTLAFSTAFVFAFIQWFSVTPRLGFGQWAPAGAAEASHGNEESASCGLEMSRKSPNPPLSATLELIDCRHVVHDEYAVSPDGMKMFSVLDLEIEMHGARSDL